MNELVRVAAENQRASDLRSSVAFEAVEVSADLDEAGRPESLHRRVFACVRHGRRLTRELVSVDGRPPGEREARKARQETDDVKTGRLDLTDMLGRYDFHYVSEDVVDGRPAHLVAFEPRPGRPVRTAKDRVLSRFAGRAWIDASELQVLRIDGRLTRPVRFAGGLALRLDRIDIVYEARPVARGIWEPCREELHVNALAALVFRVRREFRLELTGFRPRND